QPATVWTSKLQSPIWERAAAAGYNRIRTVPPNEGYDSEWRTLGYFAVTHGMDTDTVLLARVDKKKLKALRARQQKVFETGDFEPKTIYILDVRSSLIAASHAGPDDLITIADGRIVFLPGGHDLGEGLGEWPGG